MLNGCKKLQESILFEGKYRTLIQKNYQLGDGSYHNFEIIRSFKVVTILAITLDNKIVIEKQYRAGPEKITLELPAGGVEEDEEPEVSAQRELLEETGYTGDFQQVGQIDVAAYSTEREYIFVAQNCHKINKPKFDPGEYVETLLISIPELRKMLKQNQILNAQSAYISLDFLNLL